MGARFKDASPLNVSRQGLAGLRFPAFKRTTRLIDECRVLKQFSGDKAVQCEAPRVETLVVGVNQGYVLNPPLNILIRRDSNGCNSLGARSRGAEVRPSYCPGRPATDLASILAVLLFTY